MMMALLGTLGLALLRRRIGENVRSAALGLAAQAVLVLGALVALGFLTAAGFLYLASLAGAVAACLIVAGVYVVAGGAGALILLSMRPRPGTAASPAAPLASPELLAQIASSAPVGGLGAMAIILAAGFLLGRSINPEK